ncbi:MAG: alpha/beta hydrolase [Pseudomonadota bacterium]
MLSRLGTVPAILILVALAGFVIWSYRDFSVPETDNTVPDRAAETVSKPVDANYAEAHAVDNAFRSPDGVWIYYDDQGDGDQTLVLVHGWNCDRSYWQLQRDFLAERFRVVTLDLAGHGESGEDRTAWSIDAFAEDVASVVVGLDLDRVTLVGHSMGGNVVVAAAAKLGDRLERIVAVDTLRQPDKTLPPAVVSATLDNLDADYAGTVTSIVGSMFVESSAPAVRDFVIRDMAASPPAVGRGALLALGAHNPMPQLAALKVPMIVINSDYQPTDVDLLSRTVTDMRYVEMAGVGHFVMLEDPVAFTNHLLDAVSR